MIDLLPDERIDDLQCKGHQIIQNPNMFCFGMDAVLLANFVKHRQKNNTQGRVESRARHC